MDVSSDLVSDTDEATLPGIVVEAGDGLRENAVERIQYVLQGEEKRNG